MVKVEEALAILEKNIPVLECVQIQTANSLGCVLAKDICSKIDMPSFNQAAMDGYAIFFDDSCKSYEIIGEVSAGESHNPILQKGQGVRIFTGAKVPTTANTVVQQELVEMNGQKVHLTTDFSIGRNIRLRAEQIKTGDVGLKSGTLLTPASIGFLYGIGADEVTVYRRPSIALLTTGNELAKPGMDLKDGQIYESNSFMIQAAASNYGFSIPFSQTIADDFESTKISIGNALAKNDFVIITGGISVGDYDFVQDALIALGVEELFYKISQKPGKPIYFGKVGNKFVAALPGNPASSLVGFYHYVLPALRKLSGKGFEGLTMSEKEMTEDFEAKGTRALFLHSWTNGSETTILSMQSSAMLRSFALANSYVYLPEPLKSVKKGDKVRVYHF